MTLPPVIRQAAEGELPDWSRAGPERYRHMVRVADLLGAWAAAAGLSGDEQARWRAAGFLHDALRDADGEELRAEAGGELPDWWPLPLLHGPAAASRLREEKVSDEAFLRAVAYHTIGHPRLDALGRALYAADFLEPGREGLQERREELRRRMPVEEPFVLREVARLRIEHALELGRPLLPETVEFWNELVGARRVDA